MSIQHYAKYLFSFYKVVIKNIKTVVYVYLHKLLQAIHHISVVSSGYRQFISWS